MAPFALVEILGKPLAYAVYLAIGIAFGATLEMAGFADSRRLAAQFYFRNLTVLKVMFTAIVTAMVLVFLSAALGLLDYQRLWVNPTYLVPGIVGGLIMGVGFILGGFCPGTSLVAVANLKVDAMFFFVGASLGVMAFGETVGLYPAFFHSTSMGRFTLPAWLGLPPGVVVVLVVLMALFMFWGGEKLERKFGAGDHPEPGDPAPPRPGVRTVQAGALVAVAVAVMVLGQPSLADRWDRLDDTVKARLDSREIYVHPAELVDLTQDRTLNVVMLDVRDEAEFNVFHLVDARRITLGEIEDGIVGLELLSAPANTVTVLLANGELRSTEAWKLLVAGGVPNVYVLEGGLNGWLDLFESEEAHAREELELASVEPPGTLEHRFEYALGSDQRVANPDLLRDHGLEYESRVKLQSRKKLGGGCG
jgi:rhodanese-related sulfurtransferase